MPQDPSPPRSILVVEDDCIVRLVAAGMLEDAGFSVLEAGTADEAMTILEDTPGITALVTDIDMPGTLDGLALADRVSARWPHIRLVVTSGGRDLRDADVPDDGRFLPKPYRRSQLLKAIEAAA
ncbi:MULTISPECIES: response regulator [Methylorubrum]|jgi:CheY-like chemotaxis protein|uniref:Response regulator receiver protein n=2 Tax=Methylorubrum TaxID=2282523 RepID=B1ZF41_METPB|nr:MULTISPECIES: response regulator [Methylorubrum]ACB78288.1 response regulator receiver protein [Methylorubrum populi BJ001]PZP66416.1 MAG: response regulator [Methylorubrum populi]GJE74942.1 Sensor kinase CckA [Methylorubrum suomiense]